MNNNLPKWAEVEEISVGLDDNRLPLTDELKEKKLSFHISNDKTVIEYEFKSESELAWRIIEGPDRGALDSETYEAICIDKEIYLVSFNKNANPLVSVCMAIDLVSKSATIVLGTMPTLEDTKIDLIKRMKKGLDLSPVKVTILYAAIDPEDPTMTTVSHKPTRDLIGKRIKYTYGDGGVYEHIYLNELFYTWHCLAGPEQGLADTERCDCIRISTDVYLFTWHEKTVPTLGVVMVNSKEMRSNGIILGIDTNDGSPIHFGIGAKGELLNTTSY